jgi:hypothetical protein
MKYLVIAILLLFVGCSTQNKNEAASAWIAKARKPIICKFVGIDETWSGGRYWTLFDADGNTYATGAVAMSFPDTIKIQRSSHE